jgi:hypothetical protein
MLAVPADRLPAAIGDLDPGNRALLDLSLRRGVSDAEIGELLRKEPNDVARGRDAVLELLADALEVGGQDRRERVREAVAALPDDAWRAGPAPPAPPPTPPPPAPRATVVLREPLEPPPAEEEDSKDDFHFAPEGRRPRRLGLLWVLGLMAVLGVLAAIILSSGGDDDDSSGADGNRSQPAPAQGGPAPDGDAAQLAALGGGPGEGRVSITDEGATITIRGLPKPSGAYQVWLYNSVVQAQPLGAIRDGSGRLNVSLPADARRYEFLDVSLEPADRNQNHSGDSVLRAPLRELLADG